MICPNCKHHLTPEKPYSFREAFDSYLETESINCVPATYRAEKRFFQMVEWFFINERKLAGLADIRLEDLQALSLWLAKPQITPEFTKEAWSKPTLAGFLKSLKRLLKKAFHTERIPKDPTALWRIPRGKCNPRRPMTIEEFNKIYAAAQDWFKPVLSFMHMTGSRGASIAALKWTDVDFVNANVTIRTNKGGGSENTFPMYPLLREFLSRQKNQPGISGFVFKDRRGRPLTGGLISTTGSRLKKRVGLVGVVLYGLRHAMGADMARRGENMEIIRQVMGHSNINQTSHYSKCVGDAAIAKALAAARPAAEVVNHVH